MPTPAQPALYRIAIVTYQASEFTNGRRGLWVGTEDRLNGYLVEMSMTPDAGVSHTYVTRVVSGVLTQLYDVTDSGAWSEYVFCLYVNTDSFPHDVAGTDGVGTVQPGHVAAWMGTRNPRALALKLDETAPSSFISGFSNLISGGFYRSLTAVGTRNNYEWMGVSYPEGIPVRPVAPGTPPEDRMVEQLTSTRLIDNFDTSIQEHSELNNGALLTEALNQQQLSYPTAVTRSNLSWLATSIVYEHIADRCDTTGGLLRLACDFSSRPNADDSAHVWFLTNGSDRQNGYFAALRRGTGATDLHFEAYRVVAGVPTRIGEVVLPFTNFGVYELIIWYNYTKVTRYSQNGSLALAPREIGFTFRAESATAYAYERDRVICKEDSSSLLTSWPTMRVGYGPVSMAAGANISPAVTVQQIWLAQDIGAYRNVSELVCVGGGNFWTNLVFYRYDGSTWQVFDPAPPACASRVILGLPSGEIILYSGSTSSGIYHFNPATNSWSSKSLGNNVIAGDLFTTGTGFVYDSSHAYVVGKYGSTLGHVLFYDGSTWSDLTPGGLNPAPQQIWRAPNGDLWAVNWGGSLAPCIWHWNGTTWTNRLAEMQAALGTGTPYWRSGLNAPNSVHGSGTHVYFCGASSDFYYGPYGYMIQWDGASWSVLVSPNLQLAIFADLYAESTTRTFLFNTNGAWLWNGSGITHVWSPSDTAGSEGLSCGDKDSIIGVMAYSGYPVYQDCVYASFDGGASFDWKTLPSGKKPYGIDLRWLKPPIVVFDTADVTDSVSAKLYRSFSRSHNETAISSDQTHPYAVQDFHGSGLVAKRKFEPLVDPLIIRATITAQGRKVLDRAAREGLSVSPVRFTLGTGFENPRWGNEEAAPQDATDLASTVLFEGSIWTGELTLESANPKTLVIRCSGPASAQGVTEILVYAQIRHSLTEDNFREIPFASATVPIWCSTPGQVFVARIVIPLG